MSGFTGLNIESDNGLRRREGVAYATQIFDENGEYAPNFIVENFRGWPVFTAASTIGYGNPTGTAGNTNTMHTDTNYFEYNILGTQTILAPVWASTGLNIGMDQTDNDGVQLTNGITALSRAYFNVSNDNCYFELTANIAVVAGTDDFCVGFRKAEAYQANVDDYDEAAYFQWNGTDLNIETILNGGATQTVDTTLGLTNATAVTFRVEVINRVTRFYVNGSTPPTSVSYTFDASEKIIPFLFMLQANAAQTAAVYITHWESGKLYNTTQVTG